MFRVTLDACVSGDPLKAWRGTTGEDDTEHVPNDEWKLVAYDFGDDLEAAKDYVRGLDAQMTTHVVILHSDDGSEWEPIFDQDAGADHLDDAHPDVEMPHTIDTGGPVVEVAQEPPPPFEPPSSDVATEVKL